FLSARPFGAEGATLVRITLDYRSRYAQHVFGRVRLQLGRLAETTLARLPIANSAFYVAGPFPHARDELYTANDGPEQVTRIDLDRRWGEVGWRYDDTRPGSLNTRLPTGQNATYVGHQIFVPTRRKLEVSLGSDDGFQLYLDGVEIAANQVDRGARPDQDRAEFEVDGGTHALVLKVVNTGGAGGFYWRHDPAADELAGDMSLWLLPAASRDRQLEERLQLAWRDRFSPGYRDKRRAVAQAEASIAELAASTPQTMVMQERTERRDAFVLMRGQYDRPDRDRPVTPSLPAMFGPLPDDVPPDRLGLARWLVSDRNPLLHRVTVNRLFEFVFGAGLVRTSGDFGRNGERPSHPELLDWLAIEFRDHGTSVRGLLRMLVTSAAFRQQSRRRPEAAAIDGDDRLLAWYPRRRLTAEAIRDQALFASGLLVERLGGPSVKPYQPPGLWREVAMLQSNTRTFEQGSGDALWRRSLYTYWKRACPPPTLLTFDAPTREFCTIRRSVTNTPLQALALWNDEQFVEASRVLAERAWHVADDDRTRLGSIYRRCTGHDLDADRAARAQRLLDSLRARYRAAPDDARALIAIGEAPRDTAISEPEHAAFTLVASAFLNLDATLWID
ncbi:MAG: DUF1553 domain-containing protein, partial [Planctomycetes bacterium]|nr:DUF1553 domain-containing protein [Planctomycetota bacterium]